jgi:hypothetical protein
MVVLCSPLLGPVIDVDGGPVQSIAGPVISQDAVCDDFTGEVIL